MLLVGVIHENLAEYLNEPTAVVFVTVRNVTGDRGVRDYHVLAVAHRLAIAVVRRLVLRLAAGYDVPLRPRDGFLVLLASKIEKRFDEIPESRGPRTCDC